MELRQLTYFVAVCEELSFSRAATRCFISQSAISHQIARLEHDLGVQLFERSTRSVVPTDASTRLLPLAKQMLSLESAIRAAVRTSRPRIRLAANMSFATRSLSAIMRRPRRASRRRDRVRHQTLPPAYRRRRRR